MYGTCKCGAKNIGNYYGGSPGMCQECFDASQSRSKEDAFKQKNEKILQKAKQEAERLGITLSEAILLIK